MIDTLESNRLSSFAIMRKERICHVIAITVLLFGLFVSSIARAHSPHDDIHLLEVSPEYAIDKTLFIMLRNLRSQFGRVQRSTDGGLSWREMNNGLDNRSLLLSMAISPAFESDGTLFLGTVSDGIFKSIDRGDSWFRTDDGIGSVGIDLIEISPDFKVDQLVLAAQVGGGLFRSADGGKTWSQVTERDERITALGFYPDADRWHVWAADEAGQLHASSDGGLTWQRSQSTTESPIQSIACAQISASICFLGTDAHGVLHTSDGGDSLIPSNNGLPINAQGEYQAITDLALSDNFAADSTLFAITWYNAVFRSQDRGKSWHKFDSGTTTNNQADQFSRPQFSKLRVSQGHDHATIFLAGFDGLFRSDNFGSSWSELETLTTGRVEALAMSPNYVRDQTVAVVTQNGGAYISEDAGLDWTALNQGIKHAHMWDIAFSPQFESDETLLTISNHDFYWSTREQIVWEGTNLDRNKWTVRFGKLIGSDWQTIRYPLQIVMPQSFPKNKDVFFGTRYEGIYKSEDAGSSWSQLDDAPIGWVSSVAISPSYDSDGTVYAAYTRGPASATARAGVGEKDGAIYRTRNNGRDWERVTGDFDEVLSKHSNSEIRLAISPNYVVDRTIFIGTANGLFRSADGGERWTKVTQSPVVESGYVRSIGISPNFGEDKTIFIGLKGKGLYKSIDSGVSFSRIPNDVNINGYLFEYLSVSPGFEEDATIFGSADGEVLKSIDGGENWSIMSRVIRYEDSNPVISFNGDWETREDVQLSASKSKFATSQGSRATLNFVGSGVAWIGPKSSDHGAASIYIDGNLQQKVDQFSEEAVTLTEVFSISGLKPGPHTIKIEAAETVNPESDGQTIEIDAFDVLQ